MTTPPRPLVALTLALALLVGALPVPPAAPRSTAASIVTPYALAATHPVAPGASHDWGTMYTSTGLQKVNVVEVQPGDPAVRFEASLSNDRVAGLERPTAQAIRRSYEGHRVVAAINGDVWSGYANDMQHAPNGLHIQDGELMVAGTSSRATFGVDVSGRPMIGSAGVAVGLTTLAGVSVVIDRVNQERRAGEFVMYTRRFASNTSAAASGIDIVITGMSLPLRPSGAITGTVSEIREAGGGPIPTDGVVITAPATSYLLGAFVLGEQVTITTTITAGWENVTQAVGGREWVVRDGATYIYPRPASADRTHPRSAIGLTADGRVLMVTVDGRQPDESLGITLPELAQLLIARGVVSAINLDGGGSTALTVRRPGDLDVSTANSPSDGRERPVTNSIHLVSTAPTGPLAQLAVLPGTQTLYERQSVTYRVVGTDAAYNPVPLGAGAVNWTVTAPIGSVDPAGRFVAGASGSGQVVASAGGVTGMAAVTVLPDLTGPTMSAPIERLTAGRAIDARGRVPVTVSWGAASDTGSGVAGYELAQSVDGAAWTPVALSSATDRSVTLSLSRANTYRFQVRATDRAGNPGTWRVASAFALAVAPETTRALTFVKGTWTRISSGSYDGGRARSTRTPNGTARFTFTGDGFAWLAARSSVRGVARVYVDGLYVGAANTYRTKAEARVMVFSRSWTSSGRHTVEIRAVGTPGHPRVDIDGFVVLTPQPGYPMPPAS